MRRKLRPRSAYDVMAAIALFIAVAGGSAYAAATIGAGDIKNSAVLSRHIKNGAVKRADLGANSVSTGKVIDGSLLKRDFKAGQLPRGPKGDPCLGSDPKCKGPKGDPGPGIRWALVRGSDGSVLLQSGGISAVRQSEGVYYVDFGSAVTGHAISATVHSAPSNIGVVTGAIPCSGTLVPIEADTFTCAAHNTVGEVVVA